ncbi:MAG: hypothetical protein WBA45_07600 [Microthrixaceae bacterium]
MLVPDTVVVGAVEVDSGMLDGVDVLPTAVLVDGVDGVEDGVVELDPPGDVTVVVSTGSASPPSLTAVVVGDTCLGAAEDSGAVAATAMENETASTTRKDRDAADTAPACRRVGSGRLRKCPSAEGRRSLMFEAGARILLLGREASLLLHGS